jgi:hypothetical protein
VYFVWLAFASVGVAGIIASRFGWSALGALLLGMYGALGLDGLQHYSLALCSEHTLAANVTIWFEAIAGIALAVACALQVNIHLRARSGVVAVMQSSRP